MRRPISELYTKPLYPVESLHMFCKLLNFHFSVREMSLLSWVQSHVLCRCFTAVVGDISSPLGQESKLQESVLSPTHLNSGLG